MTDMTDKDALLALMYDPEPTPEPSEPRGPAPKNPIMNLATISHKMYRLERTVEEQDRHIKRLQQRIRNLERDSQNVGRAVNSMGRELDHKLDRRGD